MEKIISLNESINSLVNRYPEVREIMIDLGFDNIANDAMLNSVGRFMTLNKGSKLKKIDINIIINKFKEHGFTIKEENDDGR